jgi:hypothetical protein
LHGLQGIALTFSNVKNRALSITIEIKQVFGALDLPLFEPHGGRFKLGEAPVPPALRDAASSKRFHQIGAIANVWLESLFRIVRADDIIEVVVAQDEDHRRLHRICHSGFEIVDDLTESSFRKSGTVDVFN